MPPERVRENVAAQLRDFDGYNARMCPVKCVNRFVRFRKLRFL